MFELLAEGIASVSQLKYLMPLALGTLVGVVGGALPGVTITMTIIIVLPFTFGLEPLQGLAAMTGVYVGTRPEWSERAEAVIREELAAVARDGLTAAELADAKGQVKGQLVLSLESSSARLHRLAATALFDEPFRGMEEVMRCIDAVTLDDAALVAAEYLAPERQTVLRLGPTA